MRNDTLKGQRHTIPKECRQQVRAQLYQQRENIDFDPKLKSSCKEDIKTFCSNVPNGGGQVNKRNASVSFIHLVFDIFIAYDCFFCVIQSDGSVLFFTLC